MTNTQTTERNPYGFAADDPRQGLAVPFSDRERNGYHDSDFYVTLWDPEGGRFYQQEYGTTRFAAPTSWPTDWYLTPDHPEYERALAAARDRVADASLSAHRARTQEVRGRGVRVVIDNPVTRGKNKVEPGTTGTVGWYQEQRSQYGTWSRGWRLGIDLDDDPGRRVFIDADRVTAEGAQYEESDMDPDLVAEVRARWADADPDRVWQTMTGHGRVWTF
jgi:hypothetical protein